MRTFGTSLLLSLSLLGAVASGAQAPVAPQEGDFLSKNFRFGSGESMPELRVHYTTLGKPQKDGSGHVSNAVLILHGTGGSGSSFLIDKFADVLFGPGQLLDASRYFIILPDGIGHGKSSKPSDGLHARFPKYDYDDMVLAQYLLLTQGLHVDHLRLIMGTSMGCMHSWVWAEAHPKFTDAMMPLACLPVPIAGRNRMWRDMIITAIAKDPDWMAGEYKTQPERALRTAAGLLMIAGSAPIQLQKSYPTRAAADQYTQESISHSMAGLDANDLMYQVDASRNYNPSPRLDQIETPVMWINSGDDFINPPELGIAEQESKRLKNGRFVLLPASEQTHGHGTHTWASVWQSYLKQLLSESQH